MKFLIFVYFSFSYLLILNRRHCFSKNIFYTWKLIFFSLQVCRGAKDYGLLNQYFKLKKVVFINRRKIAGFSKNFRLTKTTIFIFNCWLMQSINLVTSAGGTYTLNLQYHVLLSCFDTLKTPVSLKNIKFYIYTSRTLMFNLTLHIETS